MTASLPRMHCRLAVLLVLQSVLFATAHLHLLIICYWIVLSLERFGLALYRLSRFHWIFHRVFHHLVIQALNCSFSSQVLPLWRTAFVTCVRAIWHLRNRRVFDDLQVTSDMVLALVWAAEVGALRLGHMENSQADLLRLHMFGIPGIPRETPHAIPASLGFV